MCGPPVPLRTTSKFCYGLLRTVTFCYVHPVLRRPTRFLIRNVTAVANFLTVKKSDTVSTAITACHVCPNGPPRCVTSIRFVHGGLKRGCRGRREHSVKVALISFHNSLARYCLWPRFLRIKIRFTTYFGQNVCYYNDINFDIYIILVSTTFTDKNVYSRLRCRDGFQFLESICIHNNMNPFNQENDDVLLCNSRFIYDV